MKYTETVEKSAEYLRLAIAHMSRQRAGHHPVSFAVWYEHVSGVNHLLSEELNALLDKGVQLTNEMVEALYNRHVSDCGSDVARRIHGELERILAHTVTSARAADERSAQVGHSLEHYSSQLEGVPDPVGLQTIIKALLTETHAMHGLLSVLQRELSDKTREMESLKEDLYQLREESVTDALTGLVNRKVFLERCNLASHAPGSHGNLCLLLADIDHFKNINDKFGHLLGDQVIRQVGQTMNVTVKGSDTAARYGGEEFTILLPDTSLDNAHRLAEQIRSKVERIRVRRSDNGSILGEVTISIGVACFRQGDTIETLIHRADMALYAAKNNGRNQVMLEAG